MLTGKEFADRVRWIHGDATTLPPLEVDLAVMTGNVAQVFLTDEDWAATLRGVRDALRPGGRFVFETRDPARRGWEEWTREGTHQVAPVADGETVETWTDLTSVELPFVSFRRARFVFGSDGAVLDVGFDVAVPGARGDRGVAADRRVRGGRRT